MLIQCPSASRQNIASTAVPIQPARSPMGIVDSLHELQMFFMFPEIQELRYQRIELPLGHSERVIHCLIWEVYFNLGKLLTYHIWLVIGRVRRLSIMLNPNYPQNHGTRVVSLRAPEWIRLRLHINLDILTQIDVGVAPEAFYN